MRNSLIVCVVLGAAALMGCTASTANSADNSDSSSDDLTSKTAWLPLMDTCEQYAVSAAAVEAFADNNLQHLMGTSVDGDLATDGTITVKVTTGNDEDGATTRSVVVAQSFDGKTGAVSCTVTKVSGKAPASSKFDKSALSAIVDPCTGAAVVAAQKASDNYWHLYGLKLDGDPAQTGDLTYTVTDGNDEDGETDYTVLIHETVNNTTGKVSCKVTSTKSSRD